jgi:RNA polymerase sigma factor (sigma-70 family)
VGGRDHASAFHLRDELWSALQALPTRMRAVLVLRYFEDLSEVETADLLGCAVGTVKSQASRGLERLRQIYAREGAAPAAVPIAPEPA